MKIFKVLWIFLITTSPLFAQQGSNLFQIITSDLPIQRNEVFRNLQTMLSDENAKELKGVDLSILHTMIDNYKKEILKYVQPLKIKVNNNKYTLTYENSSLISVNILVNGTPNELLTKLHAEVESKLLSVFDKASKKYISNETITNIVFYICYTLLSQGKIEKIDFNEDVNYKSLTASYISNQVKNDAKNVLLTTLTENQLNQPVSTLLQAAADSLNKAFVSIANKVNDEVVAIFINIQTTITNEVEKPLSENLKGLTGFTATEGTGTFSGGALYSFRTLDNKASLSVYTNFNLNTAQDTVAHSLVGLRGAYAGDKVQLDILASIFYGDKQYDAFKVFEFGFGLNYGFNGGYVMGLAGFYTHNSQNTDNSAYSVGIMFSISKSAPNVVLGFTALQNSGDKNPIIQINYPLNVSL